jgi:hypothetical protein
VLKKFILLSLSVILGFNIVIFTSYALQDNNLSRPYPKAKVLMSWARLMNEMYIFPICKLFGPRDVSFQNPLADPFYGVRHDLYQAALREIPPEDGERDLWWTAIYFSEYRTLYNPAFKKLLQYRDFNNYMITPHAVWLAHESVVFKTTEVGFWTSSIDWWKFR